MTLRRFNLRISVHERNFRIIKLDSIFAGHLINENRKFDQNVVIISKINLLETL